MFAPRQFLLLTKEEHLRFPPKLEACEDILRYSHPYTPEISRSWGSPTFRPEPSRPIIFGPGPVISFPRESYTPNEFMSK